METVSRLFPVATRGSIMRETCVVLDMEDFSIPKGLDPYLIEKKIKSTMAYVEGYRGHLSITAYVAENTWSNELQGEFWEAGIMVNSKPEGDKGARLNMILVDVIYWAMTMLSCGKGYPSILLILSNKYENIEQDPKFSRLRKALENKGFYVALARPDKLINLDGIDQSGSEKKGIVQSGSEKKGIVQGRSSETASEKPDSTIIDLDISILQGSVKVWHSGIYDPTFWD